MIQGWSELVPINNLRKGDVVCFIAPNVNLVRKWHADDWASPIGAVPRDMLANQTIAADDIRQMIGIDSQV